MFWYKMISIFTRIKSLRIQLSHFLSVLNNFKYQYLLAFVLFVSTTHNLTNDKIKLTNL